MKKTASILLAVCMLLVCLAGCGKNTSSEGDTPGKDKVEVVEDLGGYEFVIAKSTYDDSGTETRYVAGESEYSDFIYNAIAEIEAKYNCTVRWEYYEPTTIMTDFRAAMLSGTKFADMIVTQLFNYGPMLANDFLYNFDEMPGLDLSSSAWMSEYEYIGRMKGGLFAINTKGLDPESAGIRGAMVFNKSLLERLGLESPVDLIRSNRWTWDTFHELSLKAAKDLNNDGSFTEVDQYGSTSSNYDGLIPFFLTSGVKTITKTADNKLQMNMSSPEVSQALLRLKQYLTQNDGAYYSGGFLVGAQADLFCDGRALFNMGISWRFYTEMEDECVVIPMPRYDDNSDYINSLYHNNYVIVSPNNLDQAEMTGKIMQAIAEATTDASDIYWKEYSYNWVDSELFTEMMGYVSQNINMDPLTFCQQGNESVGLCVMRAIGNPLYMDGNASSFITANEAAAQAVLDEMFN